MTEVRFHHSDSFPEILAAADCSLLVSTYQAGQLAAIGTHNGRVQFSLRCFDQVMGVAVGERELAVGARDQVWRLRELPRIAASIAPAGAYSTCYLPRSTIVTGAIQGHEMAWGRHPEGQHDLWMVNTLFSSLVGLDDRYSFVPRWRPPFITALTPEDRCHLNGLAMVHGHPAYVTMMAMTNTAHGWRQKPNDAGVVMDVGSGEVVASGISMPHSPRWHEGRLYVLNSGMGRLEQVDLSTGRRDVVALVPGYARGLAFHRGLGFVGLSRIRETAVFGGTPIAAYRDRLICGIGVIDLTTGETVATLQFADGIEEIFDVQVVTDTRSVSLGLGPEDPGDLWIVPPA